MPHRKADKHTGSIFMCSWQTAETERAPQGPSSFVTRATVGTAGWGDSRNSWAPAGTCLFVGPGLLQAGLLRQRDEWPKVCKGGKRRRAEEGLGGGVND